MSSRKQPKARMHYTVQAQVNGRWKNVGTIWHYAAQCWFAERPGVGFLGAFRNKRNALAAVRKAGAR